MSLALVLAAVLATGAGTVSVRLDAVGAQQVVRLTLPDGSTPADVRREKGEVLVTARGAFEKLPQLPQVVAPLTSLTAERVEGGLVVRIGVPDDVPHEVVRAGASLTILLGAAAEDSAAPTTAELYRRILPVPLVEAAEASGGVAAGETAPGESSEKPDAAQGLILGPVALRPSLNAGYVDDEVVLEGGEKTQHESHYEAEPRVRITAPIGAGNLQAVYGPRFRWGSTLGMVNTTSHLADASLSVPLGPRLEIEARDHFVRGTLETYEVDPGNEYFSGLARFSLNRAGLSGRFEVGAEMALEADAAAGRVRFAKKAGRFDYDDSGFALRLSREVTPNLRLAAGLRYDTVDSAERREAVMHATSAQAVLRGDLAPLTRGEITLGYTWQTNPYVDAENADSPGRHFRGLTARLGVQRDLTRSASVRLSGVRSTNASGFEENGYYVTTAGRVDLSVPLPFALSFRAGTGYHLNRYRLVSTKIGAPREDRIFSWAVGLGRALGRWGYWRADYRFDRRDSNLNELDHDAHSFVVRLGIGLFEETQPR